MSPLPSISLNGTTKMMGLPSAGKLEYRYKPFFNKRLSTPKDLQKDLDFLTVNAAQVKMSSKTPVEITIEEAYDNSANLIINDKKNPPKIINSRFYLKDSRTYEIGDRKGNLDTNIYSEKNFESETSLIKTVQTIVTVDFLGLTNGGNMPVGNYTFYFKLADSDGNESDFIAESGRVVCHIGNINQPKHIRGGQLGENSGKGVQFLLKSLDLGYTYINVYYTKTTGDSLNSITTAYKIDRKFRITGPSTGLLISGYEELQEISLADINIQYTDFDSVQSMTNCQNLTFAGNIENNYEIYKILEKYSLFITPGIYTGTSIGTLNSKYEETHRARNGYEYYNVQNIHDYLGYWDQEIYRVGIVYILNDYTLSPVFNIRGIKSLTNATDWGDLVDVDSVIDIDENGIIAGTTHNSKGVFRIDADWSLNPIGLKFKFHSGLWDPLRGLGRLVKGFFMVRQPRIPTLLAQAVGISTSKHGNFPVIPYKENGNRTGTIDWLAEAFLVKSGEKVKLGSSYHSLKSTNVKNNALLCPEATLRTEVFNTFFNSSEYVLLKAKGQLEDPCFKQDSFNKDHFSNLDLGQASPNPSSFPITTSLVLIEPGIELIRNNENVFSSKIGDEIAVHKAIDIEYGDYNNPSNAQINTYLYNKSPKKVRGLFNTYLGASSLNLESGVYYNIFEKGYNFEANWLSYFQIRMNDASPYFPIGDRHSITSNGITYLGGARSINPSSQITQPHYRGDCYINTYTQRVNWNFIDSEMPTNTKIIDPYTWYKNIRLSREASTMITTGTNTEKLVYNKLLPLFTYKFEGGSVKLFEKDTDNIPIFSVIEGDGKGFKKYSEFNGTFGYDKINKPDVNAVGLGHWVTFKVCSNVNLAMRDVDLTRPMEEAVHKQKRSFFPLQSMEKQHNLPESRVLNVGISKTSGDKHYFDMGDIPFFKQFFTTRIYYSNVLQRAAFVNGSRTFLKKNFQDYSLEYGSLVKLVEWHGTLIAVMEHGILMIPVNERAMMTNESGENVYINTDNVLPQNPKVLSASFGSLWADSIIKTSRYIYGIDTVAKKIWRTNGTEFSLISDMKIQKFLNNNISLSESDKSSDLFVKSVKAHYNAFKSDILFVFQTGTKSWNLCWNELLEKWVTRYTWFPEFSENINNIFYTFANSFKHPKAKNCLYKHGFAGTKEEKGKILPTMWYEEQHPFEFEFIVNDTQGVQKIFDNLKIVSNRIEPNSFIFEIVGDSYDWSDQKEDISTLNKSDEQLTEEAEFKGLGSEFNLIL